MAATENPLVYFSQFLIPIVLTLALKLFKPEIADFAILGFACFCYFCITFYLNLGNKIPIRELIIIIALLQWVIGPILSYHFFTKSQFYYMIIDENQYMAFVIPACLAFMAGLLFPLGYKQKFVNTTDNSENPKYYLKRGLFLFITGFSAMIIRPFVPSSLGYLMLLLSNTSIIGSFYFLKAKIKYDYLLIILAILPTFINAANSAVFHEAFIWGGFIIIIFLLLKQISVILKITLMASALFIFFAINSVKKEYREDIWADIDYSTMQATKGTDQKATKIANKNTTKLIGLISQQLSTEEKTKDEVDDKNQGLIDRINQGWIVARIMYIVPKYADFADGETIMEGFKAALWPRILAPNKAMSGGQKNFERFTGVNLAGASMNLGIVGEAYANYGENGGILFMLIYGFFFNLVYLVIINKARKFPELILWMPFIFFYVIKAEEDFTSIFNQFVKSTVLMVLILFLLKRVINQKQFLSEVDEKK